MKVEHLQTGDIFVLDDRRYKIINAGNRGINDACCQCEETKRIRYLDVDTEVERA